jgi:hypothetical protein
LISLFRLKMSLSVHGVNFGLCSFVGLIVLMLLVWVSLIVMKLHWIVIHKLLSKPSCDDPFFVSNSL